MSTSLHHYGPSLASSYGFSPTLQRPTALTSMYGGSSVGYSPSDWGFSHHPHGTAAAAFYAAREPHDYLPSCAGSTSVGALSLTATTSPDKSLTSPSQPAYGQTFPGVAGGLGYQATSMYGLVTGDRRGSPGAGTHGKLVNSDDNDDGKGSGMSIFSYTIYNIVVV